MAPVPFISDKEFLSRYNFSLFIDIHEWTGATHYCKQLSTVAESLDAKDTCS